MLHLQPHEHSATKPYHLFIKKQGLFCCHFSKNQAHHCLWHHAQAGCGLTPLQADLEVNVFPYLPVSARHSDQCSYDPVIPMARLILLLIKLGFHAHSFIQSRSLCVEYTAAIFTCRNYPTSIFKLHMTLASPYRCFWSQYFSCATAAFRKNCLIFDINSHFIYHGAC